MCSSVLQCVAVRQLNGREGRQQQIGSMTFVKILKNQLYDYFVEQI